jgi:PKD repeat protein
LGIYCVFQASISSISILEKNHYLDCNRRVFTPIEIMKRNLRLTILLFLGMVGFHLFAQKPTSISQNYLVAEPEPVQGARYAPGTPSEHPMLTGGCPGNDAIGTSSNAFTHILTEANDLAVDNAINSIVFVHRNNAGAFGGHSGQLRYDLSTDGGVTWSNNQGVLNPLSVNGTNGARYPNVAIYNPAGNTTPANAYLAYYAPTVGATFNGTVSGVRRLNGTGNTETYNQPTATQTLIPRSVVKGAPGVFWSIDNVYNGTAVTGYRVLKGVWNGSTDVVWSVNTTINPTFNIALDGAVKTADYAIAFDPTGNIGWICMLTHLTPGPTPYAFYPVFYKTTNGGTSWSGPSTVDLGNYFCISGNIAPGNVMTAAFDLDLTVDVNGNPHALMPVGNGNNAYAIFFANWHAMVDVTMIDGVWNPVVLRDVYRGRGSWGTAPNAVTQDMEPQVSRTADGTKVFFTWTDADSAVVLATANQSPNLYGKAYDVTTRKWTSSYNFTSCNVTWNGKLLFPKMAETVLSNTGNYKLPIVFAEFTTGNDPISATNFHYLDSIWFAPSDFVTNQCTAAVNLAASDTIFVCGNTTLDAGAGATVYNWSTGATTQTISVTSPGTYSVSVSNNCCTGTDNVVVVFLTPPTAAYTTSSNQLTASFTNTSTGPSATYFWDFGDGNLSTQMNPSHTYGGPGTYTVCLIATNTCGADTICTSYTATCTPNPTSWTYTSNALNAAFNDLTAGNVISWAWDFGDGNQSNLQTPNHTYASAGIYTACLITTDSCGSDTLCSPVVVCNPLLASFSANATGQVANFTDLSLGGVSWFWTFGDGGTSTLQNPTHTYGTAGTFQVCLVVSDACTSDTTCLSVTTCVLPVAAFSSSANLGNVAFTDLSTSATNWSWDFGDGGSSPFQNPTHLYQASGLYTVCLTVTDACGSDTVCNSINVIIEGVGSGIPANWTLAPNPTASHVYLATADLAAGAVDFKLTNALGQTLGKVKMNHIGGGFRQDLDLTSFAQGIYFLEVRTEAGAFTAKVIRN